MTSEGRRTSRRPSTEGRSLKDPREGWASSERLLDLDEFKRDMSPPGQVVLNGSEDSRWPGTAWQLSWVSTERWTTARVPSQDISVSSRSTSINDELDKFTYRQSRINCDTVPVECVSLF